MMPIWICQPNLSCGSVADWTNVVITGLVGIAVWSLGRNTNRLASAANRTNIQALQLDREAQARAQALDEREGKLLLLYIYADIIMFNNAVTHILHRFPSPSNREGFINSSDYRQAFCAHAGSLHAGVIAEKLDRAHVLPDAVAGRLQQIVGAIKGLNFSLKYALIRAPGNTDLGDDFDNIWQGLNNLAQNSKFIESACAEVVHEFGLQVVEAKTFGTMRSLYGISEGPEQSS